MMKEPLKLQGFTANERVLAKVKELKATTREVSDVVDAEGNQYVDLVMEGGGTLGIALLGYVYGLEQAGIRFLDIGGTSAGAITAMLLAAVDTKDKPKSERLLELLATQNLGEFVDGKRGVRRFINGWLAKRPKLLLLFHGWAVLRAMLDRLGLNPGLVFQDWMKRSLAASGVHTVRDLNERMAWVPPELHHRRGEALSKDDLDCRLALIAAEVTTESKIEFPRMAAFFWKDWEQQSPALFVRASMSVPFFFEPMSVRLPHLDEGELEKKWEDIGVHGVKAGEECLLIDGGIMSNFPINLFHEDGVVPSAPTFGVRLGKRTRHTISKPGALAKAIFESARHCLDYDFILRHRDYKHLLMQIDTGKHEWLNFEVSQEAQVDLFASGVDAAAAFLSNFKWQDYKEERMKLLKA
jgi:NTE family protein